MGTCYYLARPDNRTLFDMDKAYGLRELIGCDSSTPVDLDLFELALGDWFGEWPAVDEQTALTKAADVASWARKFADGHPVFFVSEHHAWIDSDDYRDDGWLRIVADRFDGFDTKASLAKLWREKTGGTV